MARLSQEGREIGLNSELNRNKWGFVVKEQVEGLVDGKLPRDLKGRGILLKPLNRILAEGRPGDKISGVGEVRNLIRYQG